MARFQVWAGPWPETGLSAVKTPPWTVTQGYPGLPLITRGDRMNQHRWLQGERINQASRNQNLRATRGSQDIWFAGSVRTLINFNSGPRGQLPCGGNPDQ